MSSESLHSTPVELETRVSASSLAEETEQRTGSSNQTRDAFARHLIVFTSANILSLSCNAVLAFLLPRWLSVEEYGHYRLFILCSAFVGVVHAGFVDGLLLRWAARPVQRMRLELKSSLRFMFAQHAIILLPVVLVAFTSWDNGPWPRMVVAVAAFAVAWNWTSLGQSALQATKRFEVLSVFTLATPVCMLLCTCGLRARSSLNARMLTGAYTLSFLLLAIGQWALVQRQCVDRFESMIDRRGMWRAWVCGTAHLKLGWSILLANLVVAVALSLDRILLGAWFSIRDFAVYSFAANALSLNYTMIVSITRVVLPYFSQGSWNQSRARLYWLGQEAIIILWAGGLASFFAVAPLVRHWLPRYVDSLILIRTLMLAIGFSANIFVLHGTYFWIARKQQRFLVGSLTGLVSAGLFLCWGWRSHAINLIAVAMVASAAVWWLVDEFLLRDELSHSIGQIFRSFGLIALCGAVFLVCAAGDQWVGSIAYVLWMVCLIRIAGRRTLNVVRSSLSRSLLPLPGLRTPTSSEYQG